MTTSEGIRISIEVMLDPNLANEIGVDGTERNDAQIVTRLCAYINDLRAEAATARSEGERAGMEKARVIAHAVAVDNFELMARFNQANDFVRMIAAENRGNVASGIEAAIRDALAAREAAEKEVRDG